MTHRTTAILLAISVALNLFFLGVVTSWAWHQRQDVGHERRMAAAHGGSRPDTTSWLSEAERAELRPRRKALRSLRREAEQSLRAEAFDAEKFRGSLSALRAETDAIQTSLHELMVRKAAGASIEERRKLADASWPDGPRRRSHEKSHPR
jgi:uncharacterized membrane protein